MHRVRFACAHFVTGLTHPNWLDCNRLRLPRACFSLFRRPKLVVFPKGPGHGMVVATLRSPAMLQRRYARTNSELSRCHETRRDGIKRDQQRKLESSTAKKEASKTNRGRLKRPTQPRESEGNGPRNWAACFLFFSLPHSVHNNPVKARASDYEIKIRFQNQTKLGGKENRTG